MSKALVYFSQKHVLIHFEMPLKRLRFSQYVPNEMIQNTCCCVGTDQSLSPVAFNVVYAY